jgi:hypothetical protein
MLGVGESRPGSGVWANTTLGVTLQAAAVNTPIQFFVRAISPIPIFAIVASYKSVMATKTRFLLGRRVIRLPL